MKIGIFTDAHYGKSEPSPQIDPNKGEVMRMYELSLGKMKKTFAEFDRQGVELCFCLGDIVDANPTSAGDLACMREVSEEIGKHKFKFYFIPGNHDYYNFSADELAFFVGHEMPPYYVDTDRVRFVLLDCSYARGFIRYDEDTFSWDDSNLPKEQIEFLKNALKTDKKCVVMTHQNLDSNVGKQYIIKQAGAIRRIIEESKNVDLVLQGHYHFGADNIINGVRYLTVKGMVLDEEIPFEIMEF